MSCSPPKWTQFVRCPECGSTDAGADESQSAYDFTFMQCNDCGHGALQDIWQVKFDWNLHVDHVEGHPIPDYLEPLPDGEDLHSSTARDRENK